MPGVVLVEVRQALGYVCDEAPRQLRTKSKPVRVRRNRLKRGKSKRCGQTSVSKECGCFRAAVGGATSDWQRLTVLLA